MAAALYPPGPGPQGSGIPGLDREPRKLEQPSDHAPVIAELA